MSVLRAIGQGLALLALLPLSSAGAQSGVAGGLGATAPATQRPAERVRAALNQIGASVCGELVYRAADYLFEKGEGEFTLQPLGRDSNRWPVVLTIESAHTTPGATRLSILTLAPAGTCSGSYVQVITWPQSCATLKTTIFPLFKNERPLFRSVRQSELTPGIQLYLMPAAAGCVSVKKELIG